MDIESSLQPDYTELHRKKVRTSHFVALCVVILAYLFIASYFAVNLP